MILPIIIATTIVGAISLIGVIFIFNRQIKPGFLRSFISLAAGSMLAVSFLDLLPEAIEASHFTPRLIFSITLFSILFFFLFEKIIHWHHCRCEIHGQPCGENKKNLIYFNLIGDAIHNLIDGFLVAAAFILDWQTGLAATLAVIIHEIPQEISDFGVLLYGGLTKTKALAYNFLVALTAILGAISFYFFSNLFIIITPIMAALAAGNFIYLATADLIPELHHEKEPKEIINHSFWLILGVLIIFILGQILPS